MPVFFFHLHDGNSLILDEEGQDFADLSEARLAAMRSIRGIAADDLAIGELNVGAFIEIEAADRSHVATIRFSDAVKVSNDGARLPRPHD